MADRNLLAKDTIGFCKLYRKINPGQFYQVENGNGGMVVRATFSQASYDLSGSMWSLSIDSEINDQPPIEVFVNRFDRSKIVIEPAEGADPNDIQRILLYSHEGSRFTIIGFHHVPRFELIGSAIIDASVVSMGSLQTRGRDIRLRCKR